MPPKVRFITSSWFFCCSNLACLKQPRTAAVMIEKNPHSPQLYCAVTTVWVCKVLDKVVAVSKRCLSRLNTRAKAVGIFRKLCASGIYDRVILEINNTLITIYAKAVWCLISAMNSATVVWPKSVGECCEAPAALWLAAVAHKYVLWVYFCFQVF